MACRTSRSVNFAWDLPTSLAARPCWKACRSLSSWPGMKGRYIPQRLLLPVTNFTRAPARRLFFPEQFA